MVSMLAVSVITSTLTTKAKFSAEATLETEREKTRSNLLRAISHDLRTPLTGILGASSAILENDPDLSTENRLQLVQDIQDDRILTITIPDGEEAA
jgi:two-component system sensor histidine kinase KdpD